MKNKKNMLKRALLVGAVVAIGTTAANAQATLDTDIDGLVSQGTLALNAVKVIFIASITLAVGARFVKKFAK